MLTLFTRTITVITTKPGGKIVSKWPIVVDPIKFNGEIFPAYIKLNLIREIN